VNISLSPKLGTYLTLAAAGFLAAVLLGRPELAIIALPFALIAATGLATAQRPLVDVEVELERDRVIEGETTGLAITLTASVGTGELALDLILPTGIEVVSGGVQRELALATGVPRRVEFELCARRWGGYVVGEVRIRLWDRLGLRVSEQIVVRALPLRVYPAPDLLRSILAPLETQSGAGNFVSRRRGDGIEFADVRAFAPGDRVRHINWRVSARRGELHVNQHHLERNSDVILFLDTFAEVGREGATTLDLAVRGAATLATRYLGDRDRVGMIGFGGILRWLRPGMGLRQLYRLLDSLLDTQIVTSYAWKGIDVIPSGTLPAKALLIAFSPLLDERSIGALLDVRGRGFDVGVIELDPDPMVTVRPDELGNLAARLWRLRRDALRERFRRAGIPVATWNENRSLEAALEEVRGFRRQAVLARG